MYFAVLKRILDFLLYSNIYIAIACLIKTYQSFAIFDFIPILPLYGLVFFGTLSSYNFHIFLSKNYGDNKNEPNSYEKRSKLHFLLSIIAFCVSIYFIVQLIESWYWILPAVLLTFLYSAPKLPQKIFSQLRIVANLKTIFLAFVWTYVTSVFPLVLLQINWESKHYLYIVNQLFFIYTLCIVFDFKDRVKDRSQGIKSLITQMNVRAIDYLFYASTAISIVSLVALQLLGLATYAVIAIALAQIIILSVYQKSKRNKSYYFFYLFLDGIIMLPGIIIFLFHLFI